ncbi:hypothetical protein [Oerskovia sp. Root22]|uniref:hypothetical protein n=1 Tax=Oerskovia sp. Root22 TaxID=1736494 RepID=UPI0006FF8087|nr:hypothetical protein ASE15_00285 [Oerskovia sp. Root22]
MDGQEVRQLAEEPDELDEPDVPLDEDVPVEPLDDEPLLDESDDLDPAEGAVDALPAPMLDDFEDRESVR